MSRCAARTEAGKPCRMPAIGGGDLCFNHAAGAEAAQKRRAARKRGGKETTKIHRRTRNGASIPLASIKTHGDVVQALAQVAHEVHGGKLSARDGAVTVQALQALAHSKFLPAPAIAGDPYGEEVIVEIDAPDTWEEPDERPARTVLLGPS